MLHRIAFKFTLSIILVTAAVDMGGCSFSPVIAAQSVDYNSTVEDVTDNILVTNVLRGRDGAPLFFSDISQIRGSITSSAMAQTTFPFGPINRPLTGTGVRDSAQGTLSIASNPSFDIAPSNTKQFYQGILEPLSENVLAYYLLRGIEADWVLNLLVSGIDEIRVEHGHETVLNTYSAVRGLADGSIRDPHFLRLVDSWFRGEHGHIKVVLLPGSKKFGPPVPAEPKALVEAAAAGINAEPVKGKPGYVQFQKVETKLNLCAPDGSGNYRIVEVLGNSIVKRPSPDTLPASNSACNGAVESTVGAGAESNVALTIYRVRTRSVEALFNFLGFILQTDDHRGLPFFVYGRSSDHDRFSLSYRGSTYYVRESGDGDETLSILGILNDLLNLNRDANEVPTTKAVQPVGGAG